MKKQKSEWAGRNRVKYWDFANQDLPVDEQDGSVLKLGAEEESDQPYFVGRSDCQARIEHVRPADGLTLHAVVGWRDTNEMSFCR